jgi:hypothetical protein
MAVGSNCKDNGLNAEKIETGGSSVGNKMNTIEPGKSLLKVLIITKDYLRWDDSLHPTSAISNL